MSRYSVAITLAAFVGMAAAPCAAQDLPRALAPAVEAVAGGMGTDSAHAETLMRLLAPYGVSPQMFGARCDGIGDDTVAMAAWAAAMGAGVKGVLPAGTCLTDRPIALPAVPRGSVIGAGSGASTIVYTGRDERTDILSLVGTDKNTPMGWTFQGFTVDSRTRMRGGAGIHLKDVVRSSVTDVLAAGQDGSMNLWNGFWFDRVDQIPVRQYQAQAQNDGIDISGSVGGSGPRSDVYLLQGKVAMCAVGLRIGGGFGGLNVDQSDIEFNGTNLVIDNSLVREGNRELMFGATAGFDNAQTGDNVVIADTLAGSAAYINFSGTWIASNQVRGKALLHVMPGVQLIVQYTGGSIFNSKGDGLLNDSPNAQIHLTGTLVRHNAGFGLNSVPGHNLSAKAMTIIDNGRGTDSPNFVVSN